MADIANDAAPFIAPQAPATTTHDDAPPAALLSFMVTQWAPKTGVPVPLEGAAYFAARRKALSASFPGEVLIVPTGVEKVRANDTSYRFRAGTDF
jgi:Xaa-Pro aminopeptidase